MAEAHAPGKLVICGEYAVLAGAPAIAVAVNVRARASVAIVTGSAHLLVAGSGAWPFEWQAGGSPRWREAPPGSQGRVLESVAETLAANGVAMPSAVEISLDTRAFVASNTPEKLGLGSSAAIVVALTAALLAQVRRAAPSRDELLPLCLNAHRRLQGGSGSGVDVAAAVHGGVVTLAATNHGAAIRPLAWPAGLAWLAVWTGRGASTPAMLGRFERFRTGDPKRFERHMAELRRLATEAVEAWEHAAIADLLRALADYDDALRALDEGAGIGIYTPDHDRLARDAQARGAVYKVSGAGGGDFGIAFADSADVIEALRDLWSNAGHMTLAVETGVAGVTVTA